MSLHLLVAFLAYWNIFILFSSFIHFLPTKNSNPMKLIQTKFWYFLEPLNNLCTYLLNAFLYSCFFLFPWSPQATTSRVGVCIGPQIPELILSKLPNKGRLKGTTNHLVSVSRSCTTTTLQPPLRASVHRCHQRPGPALAQPRPRHGGAERGQLLAARGPRHRPAAPAGWRGDCAGCPAVAAAAGSS
jgi:hypothetical protein